MVKDLISYAASSLMVIDSSHFLVPFFSFLVLNGAFIQKFFFVLGFLVLFVSAVFVALRVPFHARSVMGVLHEEGSPSGKNVLPRFFLVFLLFLGFFLFVFNLVMEWLAIAVDAPLLFVAFLFYFVLFIKHKVSFKGFLEDVGNVGSDFYSSFIDHFRYKHSFFLGVVGLLVLHALTDVGVFLIPYLLGVKDPLYFSALGPGHSHVWAVLSGDWVLASGFLLKVSLLVVFLANIVGFFLLFFSPAVIWRSLWSGRLSVPRWFLWLFFSSLPALFFAPLFRFRLLSGESLLGVDILTGSMINRYLFFVALGVLFLFSLFFLLRRFLLRRFFVFSWFFLSFLFLGLYAFFYLVSFVNYYWSLISLFFSTQEYFFGLVFSLFLLLTLAFYVVSWFLFFFLFFRAVKNRKFYE